MDTLTSLEISTTFPCYYLSSAIARFHDITALYLCTQLSNTMCQGMTQEPASESQISKIDTQMMFEIYGKLVSTVAFIRCEPSCHRVRHPWNPHINLYVRV